MQARARLLLGWLALVALGTWWTGTQFQLSADLRHFLPAPRTEAQRLLLQNIGESPGSRLLLLAVQGDEATTLARLSAGLKRGLAGHDEITFVANGEESGDRLPDQLLSYRYLLSDAFDSSPLDLARWHGPHQQRWRGTPGTHLAQGLRVRNAGR